MTTYASEFRAPAAESPDPSSADLVGGPGKPNGVACELTDGDSMEASFVIVNGGDADDREVEEETPNRDPVSAGPEISVEGEKRLGNGRDRDTGVDDSEIEVVNLEGEYAKVCAEDEKIEACGKEDNGSCEEEEEEKNGFDGEGENVKECEEGGGIRIEDEKSKEEDDAATCLENGHGHSESSSAVEVNEAMDTKADDRVEMGSAEHGADQKPEVVREVRSETENVDLEIELQVERKKDPEIVISESSHPAESELPVEVVKEKHELEAVPTEASDQTELQLDFKEIEEHEVVASYVEDPEKLESDVSVEEEKHEPEAILIDEKHKIEAVEVRDGSSHNELDSAGDTASEQNPVTVVLDESGPGKEEPATDLLPIENDDKGLPSETTGMAEEEVEPEIAMDVDEGVPVDDVNNLQLQTDVSDDPAASSKSLTLLDVNEKESSGERKPELDGKNTGSSELDECTNRDDDGEVCVETEATEGIQDSPSLHTDGERVDGPVTKWSRCYLVKVPRFIDEKIEKELQHIRGQLDEKTESRDSITAAIRKQKDIIKEFREKLDTARSEERAARDAMTAKREEIKDAQSVIGKIESVTSIDDIEEQIHSMEQKIQHETMPLKQEKQYINEIKKMRQRHDELCLKMGSQAEIQKAFDQKDQIEERLNLLRKEFNSLRTEVSLAEGRAKAARKEYDDEYQCLKDLQERYNVANKLRQEAYLQLQKLNTDSKEKKKYFYMYKQDQSAAKDYSLSGDKEKLQNHCSNQVEKFMELWNNDEEFRKQYIKFNEASTLRRLKTLDGRSLGPDEEPPLIHSSVDKSLSKAPISTSSVDAPVLISAPDTTQESSDILLPRDKRVMPVSKVLQNIQSANSKKSAKASSKVTSATSASNQEEEEEVDMGKRLSKEEDELARKEEVLRKEKAAAELKELLKVEQRAKAKEAVERKKRKVEKAQAKAEYKAQKEAEEKEKRRAKKEKKKAGMADTNGPAEGENASITDFKLAEITGDFETTTTTISKRSSKLPPTLKKSNKGQPLPLPPRNRSKRKMQTWMWVLLIALLVIALFFAGNYVSFSKFVLPNFGF